MDDFDLILAMAGDVLSDIRDIAGQRFEPSRIRLFMDITRPGEELDVPDPWYGEEPDYHEVFEILNEVCAELVRQQISTTSKLKI